MTFLLFDIKWSTYLNVSLKLACLACKWIWFKNLSNISLNLWLYRTFGKPKSYVGKNFNSQFNELWSFVKNLWPLYNACKGCWQMIDSSFAPWLFGDFFSMIKKQQPKHTTHFYQPNLKMYLFFWSSLWSCTKAKTTIKDYTNVPLPFALSSAL